MPHTISLQNLSNNFTAASKIDVVKLSEIISQDKKFKIEVDNSIQTLFILHDDHQWYPLLWLTDEKAYINSAPVFDMGLYYALVNVAERMNAAIISEEGLLLFIPGYGLLYDPGEGIDKTVPLHDLQATLSQANSLTEAIQNIPKKQEASTPMVAAKPGKSRMDTLLTSKKANIIAIVLAIIFCIILVLKGKKS